jgi:prepilin-type N-terminal cleavage/methylation domain-containing protein
MLRSRKAGFTLTEMAVVLVIVALLIGGAMATVSLQVETRNNDETMRRLNAAADAIIAYGIVNKRLPCPAISTSSGVEAPYGGGTCTNNFDGFLPAQTIGFTPVDSSSFAVDVWGNRIRYAVASAVTGCTGTPTNPHFTSSSLKANGLSCRPNDLEVWNGFEACIASTAANIATCTTGSRTVTRVASAQTTAFVVYSTGKNGAITASHGTDETANTNGDKVFVYRTPSDSASPLGAYDDVMVIVPASVVYSKFVTAGVLP